MPSMPHLYKMWVLQKDTGLNLVDATIEEVPDGKKVDGNLISGLLTSFLMFTEEIMKEPIRIMETQSFRLIYAIQDDLVTVIMMDRVGPVSFAEKILKRAQNNFLKKYRAQIEASYLGDVTAFTEITAQIEEITQHRGIKLVREIAKNQRDRHIEEMKQIMRRFIQNPQ